MTARWSRIRDVIYPLSLSLTHILSLRLTACLCSSVPPLLLLCSNCELAYGTSLASWPSQAVPVQAERRLVLQLGPLAAPGRAAAAAGLDLPAVQLAEQRRRRDLSRLEAEARDAPRVSVRSVLHQNCISTASVHHCCIITVIAAQ